MLLFVEYHVTDSVCLSNFHVPPRGDLHLDSSISFNTTALRSSRFPSHTSLFLLISNLSYKASTYDVLVIAEIRNKERKLYTSVILLLVHRLSHTFDFDFLMQQLRRPLNMRQHVSFSSCKIGSDVSIYTIIMQQLYFVYG